MDKKAHLLQNRNSISGHSNRVKGFVFKNSVENFILVVAAERRLAEQHLVHEHTKRPPVDGTAVSLFKQNLHRGEDRKRQTREGLTSGAMNSGVPQNVLVVEPNHISSLQRP